MLVAASAPAQTAIATIGTAAVAEQVDWKMVLSASLVAGLLSLLTSLKGLPEIDVESLKEEDSNAEK